MRWWSTLVMVLWVVGCAVESPEEVVAGVEQGLGMAGPTPGNPYPGEPLQIPQNCCYAPPGHPGITFCPGTAVPGNHVLCIRPNGTAYPAAYCGMGTNGCSLGDVCFEAPDPCTLASLYLDWNDLEPGPCLGACGDPANTPVYHSTSADSQGCCKATAYRACTDAEESEACGCADGSMAVTQPSQCGPGTTPTRQYGRPYYCCIAAQN